MSASPWGLVRAALVAAGCRGIPVDFRDLAWEDSIGVGGVLASAGMPLYFFMRHPRSAFPRSALRQAAAFESKKPFPLENVGLAHLDVQSSANPLLQRARSSEE